MKALTDLQLIALVISLHTLTISVCINRLIKEIKKLNK